MRRTSPRYLVLFALLLGGLLAGCQDNADDNGLPPTPGNSRLYVVQWADESLAEINLQDSTIIPHVLDLGTGCNDIVKHNSRLYVANSLLDNIQEIDAETNQSLRTISVTPGVNPWTLAFLNEDTIAVTCWVSRQVVMIGAVSGDVIGEISTPAGPEGIMVSGDRFFVCITNLDSNYVYGPGSVRVYDRHTWEVIDSVSVGKNPQYVMQDSTGRLHVVCTGDYAYEQGKIYVIDPATLDLLQVLDVGGTPSTVSFGGGYAFVAAGGFAGSGEVFRYRLGDLAILNDATNPISTGTGVVDVEALSSGSFLVSCEGIDEVQQYDYDGNLLRNYQASDGPQYMVLYP